MSITKKDEEDFQKGMQEWLKAAKKVKKSHFPKSERVKSNKSPNLKPL